MIDTVRLVSPFLTEVDVERIEQSCILRSAVEVATGDLQYSLTTGSLSGSWDTRVSVRVEREAWLPEYQSCKLPSAPYLIIEGSIHKALMGHNVYGGPLPPVLSCCWFVDDVAARLGVTLPYAEDWVVQRIDWAEAYELPSAAACEEYVRGLNMSEFPRRTVMRYGSESLMAPGRTTAFKVYHKGPEFLAHDKKRLKQHLNINIGHIDEPEQLAKLNQMMELEQQAMRVLRLETSIKARKLTEDFKGKPTVLQLTETYLEETHDREVLRLLKEASTDMETARTHLEVSRRLEQSYSPELASRLFGTWMQLATLGDKVVQQKMSRPTYYRQRKQLVDVGCSWNAADVQLVSRCSEIPVGFSPVRLDPRRLTAEAEEVWLKLYSYQRAA